ncbi:MAG: SDR family NAD(P)-dependent oxidoreductase [Gammaproteobacteria bacterium]
MNTQLKNKLVCITGASSGIGAACAELLAQYGARLLLIARRKDRLQTFAKTLQQQGANVHLLTLDVRNAEDITRGLSELPNNWQSIEILINNAGLAAGADKFQQADVTDWDIMIDTNVKGLLYITHAIVPGMISRQSGHIVNIGSLAGHEVYSRGTVYCATKHAVAAITKGLRQDLLGTGIRVSTVDPGMVKTEFSQVRFKGDEARAEAVYTGLTPLTAEDIANAVYYCLSQPKYVNIAEILILPTNQASAQAVHRTTSEKPYKFDRLEQPRKTILTELTN